MIQQCSRATPHCFSRKTQRNVQLLAYLVARRAFTHSENVQKCVAMPTL